MYSDHNSANRPGSYSVEIPVASFIINFKSHTHTHTHTHTYIYVYIYIKVKLATLVVGDQKVPFSIATKLRCRGGCYSFP